MQCLELEEWVNAIGSFWTLCGSDLGQAFNQSEAEGSWKLDRKPSLRRKLGALIRGSSELPAAINRGLQPIRRSLSFSKDLNRTHEKKPYRTRSVQWYNSLSSLAENDPILEDSESFISEEELYPPKVITRTHSLLEKYPVRKTFFIDFNIFLEIFYSFS